MSSRLLSPRARPRPLTDLGRRAALVGGQRLRRDSRPRRQARGRRWRRAALLGLGLAALGLAGLGGAWLLTDPRFAVARVEVRGAETVAPATVRAAAGIAPGTNIFLVEPRRVAARVQLVPEVWRAEVVRELPNRVTIRVEERRPFTLVHDGRLHWVDEEGRLLGQEPGAVAPPVPVISGLSEAELVDMRRQPSPRAVAAIALIRTLLRTRSRLVESISEIDMGRPEGPVLYTVEGIEVLLGTDHWEERLARLEGVLAEVGTLGSPVAAVDLRFRDQVVLRRGVGGGS